jgi:hypothetical protein
MSTANCGPNQVCGYTLTSLIVGICQNLVAGQSLCVPQNPTTCTGHADCQSPAYSYCAVDKTSNTKYCTGLGIPGTASACDSGNNSGSNSGEKSGSSLTKTLEYAGIAVGCVVVLAISFFVVRWNKNRSRSKMPDFDQMDYGMTSRRRSEPRSSMGASNALGGGARVSEQAYPFSSRPHAGINTAAANDQDVYYDDQYYEDPNMVYGGQNMHAMAGMAGGAAMKDAYYAGHDQYDPNSYDQNGYAYDQAYYKETYGEYDQHGNYIGGVATGGTDGFYDNVGYTEYDQQPLDHQQHHHSVQLQDPTVSTPTSSATHAVSPRQQRDYAADQYAAEPSELDFGGSGHGSQVAAGAPQAGVHGSYGQQY